MKITKYIIGLSMMAGTVLGLPSCTDLSETVYDQVMAKNYYNTKQDVINAVFRPFEHIYESTCIAVSGYAMRTRNFPQTS